MTMLAQARELAAQVGSSLEDFIEEALPNGVVYIGPQCVIVARLEGDAAIITLAIGRGCLHKLFALAPDSISRVAWARELKGREAVQYYTIDRLKRLLAHEQTETRSSRSGSAACQPVVR